MDGYIAFLGSCSQVSARLAEPKLLKAPASLEPPKRPVEAAMGAADQPES